MSSEIPDVLRALEALAYRNQPGTRDQVAAELLTTRADVTPPVTRAAKLGLVRTTKRSNGIHEFGLTTDGERALAEQT